MGGGSPTYSEFCLFFSHIHTFCHLTQAILNMVCCCFFLLAKFIYSIVFGALQRVEEQHMRDKFWNFVFYKFIFVFGVMNVQEMQEMLCWCVWFAVLGTLLLTEQLCKDRFQFVSQCWLNVDFLSCLYLL